jgi:hypothetical protein
MCRARAARGGIITELPIRHQYQHIPRGAPHDTCFLAGGRGGWVVDGTMNLSPSTDRQYRDFNIIDSKILLYKAGTYATGTSYLRDCY